MSEGEQLAFVWLRRKTVWWIFDGVRGDYPSTHGGGWM